MDTPTVEIVVGQCLYCPFAKIAASRCRFTNEKINLYDSGPTPKNCPLRKQPYLVIQDKRYI